MPADNLPLLTPSKVAAMLACDHYATLDRMVADGAIERPSQGVGSFAQLLLDKGEEHEQACLADYAARGRSVHHVSSREKAESFSDWVARVTPEILAGHEVLYQAPFVHDGVRGIADFLERIDLAGGRFSYEPVDAKLARVEAKSSHVLQLCFYADAVEALLGTAPTNLHVWLGSGEVETVRRAEVAPVWDRLRRRLLAEMASVDHASTEPAPCRHCQFCEFGDRCETRWRDADAVHLVAGVTSRHAERLAAAGIHTMTSLAEAVTPVSGLDDAVRDRLHHQAALQQQAVAAGDVPVRIVPAGAEGDPWGRGLHLLPVPDDGDVFLDFEGHPFWAADRGLFFLFGYIAKDDEGIWAFTGRWAHDVDEEAAAVRWLLADLARRRAQSPGMHVYHYNHTERSALLRLCADHGVDPAPLEVMIREGVFVDLLEVVRNAVQLGVESYSLKQVERAARYERQHDIDAGAGAVVAYEQYTKDVRSGGVRGRTHEDDADLERIAAYNEDDVRATLATRDWLVSLRPDGLPWRPAVIDPEPDGAVPDELIEQVRALPAPEDQLLADVLGYWDRERRADLARLLSRASSSTESLLTDHEAIADVKVVGMAEDDKGRRLLTIEHPAQPHEITEGRTVAWLTADGTPSYATVMDVDAASRHLTIRPQPDKRTGLVDTAPRTLAMSTYVSPTPKPDRLRGLAERAIEAGSITNLDDAGARLICRLPTRLSTPGPAVTFPADLAGRCDVARNLDRSHLAVQGPPGTGKTWLGARLIRTLLEAGQRVGITAMSHAAVHNLVQAVHDLYVDADGSAAGLAAIVKNTKGNGPLDVRYTTSNSAAANRKNQLIAGTTWLFAGKDMQAAPVDTLVVDEAGQLGLADVLAAASSATNIILLGDPQQLPQVNQAGHPGGAGNSVLGHVLVGRDTIPDDEGIFLGETWRMHPEITEFISDQFYEGRLASHDSCSVQSTDAGVGLRFVPVEHAGNSTRSEAEADAVLDIIRGSLGTTWTGADGNDRGITPADILVVTPYNDQRRLLRARIEGDAGTAGVRVGTVDSFQGQEAAVVIFSAAASSGTDASRGVGFVFDRNRFNVAISRARCLAHLVCSPQLLDEVPQTVEGLRTMAAPCLVARSA